MRTSFRAAGRSGIPIRVALDPETVHPGGGNVVSGALVDRLRDVLPEAPGFLTLEEMKWEGPAGERRRMRA